MALKIKAKADRAMMLTLASKASGSAAGYRSRAADMRDTGDESTLDRKARDRAYTEGLKASGGRESYGKRESGKIKTKIANFREGTAEAIEQFRKRIASVAARLARLGFKAEGQSIDECGKSWSPRIITVAVSDDGKAHNVISGERSAQQHEKKKRASK